jgi:molecular chaperone GrpE
MSDFAPPGVPADAAVAGAPALSAVLADFQRWYEQAQAGDGVLLPPAPPPAVDLATLLGHFVALRQEVNLQTRSVRAQQEQTADFFRRLDERLTALTRPAPTGDRETLRPLLKTLVDLFDALALAGQQIERVQAAVLPLLDDLARVEAGPPPARRSFWSRWFGSPPSNEAPAVGQEKAQEAAGRIGQAIEGLATGYTMSLERIDLALEQHGLQPMPAVGDRFDPEQMEVVEAVHDTGRPSGEVVEVVRRGYLHDGRVFRYAQVRVARS